MTVSVSAVIATRGNVSLDKCLQSLLIQGFPIQVIVVDQLMGEAARASCERYPGTIIHVPCNGHGLSLGRNVGLDYATSDYILFPDDDCFYAENFLSEALSALERDDMDFVTGTSLDPETNTQNHTTAASGHTCRILNQTNILYSFIEFAILFRKETFESLRFDERIGTGSEGLAWSDEGADLLIRAMRIGMRGEFVPTMIAYHPDNAMMRNEHTMRRAFRYSVGRGYTLRRYWFGLNVFIREFYRPLCGAVWYAMRLDWRWRYYFHIVRGKLFGLFYTPKGKKYKES